MKYKGIMSLGVVFCWIFFVLLVYEINFDVNRIHFVEIYYPKAWAIYKTIITKPMTIKTDGPVIIMLSTFKDISGNGLTIIGNRNNSVVSYCNFIDNGEYGIEVSDKGTIE